MRPDTDTRRRHIRNLIASSEVTNQATIQEALAEDGFEVTQATISLQNHRPHLCAIFRCKRPAASTHTFSLLCEKSFGPGPR